MVAQEVKSLAVQTAHATEKIASQIEAVQNSTRFAVEAIRRNTEHMLEIDGYTSAVSPSLEQQNSATDEISRNVSSAAGGAKEWSACSTRSPARSAETRNAASKVLEASESVEAAAADLQHRIEASSAGSRSDASAGSAVYRTATAGSASRCRRAISAAGR